ncbi:MAG: lipopolysaccharide heptosyltransferase I [Tepidisphaeraceae bacterium]
MPMLDPNFSPRRVLLIKPSALGDVVHALPILNLLHRRWPDARISWLVNSTFAELLEGHPQLERVIRFDRDRLANSWWNPGALRDLGRFIGALRDEHFDLVVDLQGLLRSGLAARLSRASHRVGFANARELAWLFYTDRVRIDHRQHAMQRYLALAAAIGCGSEPVEFLFPVTDDDRRTIRDVAPDSPFVVLLPGTNWPTKRWPVERFAAVVEPLARRFGLQSVVAGGADVNDIAVQIPGAVNLAGRTTLRQLVALLERADLVIANDSGPMHIAAALNRPLVTLFGPTNPDRTGPWGRDDAVLRIDIPCSPCYSRRCSHQSCLKWIGSEDVLAQVNIALAKRSGKGGHVNELATDGAQTSTD